MKKGELRREKVNLIIVGNQNSGKTSLINKFLDGDSSSPLTQKPSATSTTQPSGSISKSATSLSTTAR